MATTVARLEAILTANTRDFDRGMAKSETKIQKTGRVAGLAGLAIAGGLAYGLDKSVKAALAAQVSQARLEQAFKTSGLSAVRYAKAVDVLESSGRKLGFTDEQTKTSLGSLLIATHSMSTASKDLSVAQDIARFKHVDLEQATKSLTMAMAGSQRALKQLGIDVPKVTLAQDALRRSNEDLTTVQGKADLAEAKLIDKHRTAALVIETVRQKLGGQADAYSNTASGGMEQFRAQLDHLEVSLGKALLPALASVAASLASLTGFFSRHATVTKIVVAGTAALAATLLTVSIATKAVTAATKIYTAVQWLLNVALTANPIGIVVVALAALGAALVVAYFKVKFFRDGVQATFSWIKQNWPLLVGIMMGPIGVIVEQLIVRRGQIVNIFRNLPGQIAAAFTAGTDLVKDAIVGLFHKVIGWVKGALGISSPSKVFHQIGRDSIMGFIHGVGSMAGVLKDAVVGIAKSIPGKVLGSIPGAKGTITGEGLKSGVHASPELAKQFAVTQLDNFGWGPSQMSALAQLWNGESGWRWNAENSSSGAYGIPQSLPASKMASAGGDWHDNAFTQIKWGMEYIKSRYGSPSSALSAWESRSPHWYDKGGWLPTGLSLAMNATGRPERVLGPGESHGTTTNNFHFPNYIGSQNELAGQIFDVLQAYENRNGRPYGGGF